MTSHQTVRLGRGAHARPADGACVMELASMLSGERFSDHPKSVCRVIASFLRAYNDAVDDGRRQDLYRCAADVVGTRSSRATERARIARCEGELLVVRDHAPPRPWQIVMHALRAMDPASNVTGFFACLAQELAAGNGGHERALRLVDDLIAIEVPPAPPCRPMSGEPAMTTPQRQAIGS
jgi:hypothetical protein